MKFKPGDIVERVGGYNFSSTGKKYGKVLTIDNSGWCHIEGEFYYRSNYDQTFDNKTNNYYNPHFLIKKSPLDLEKNIKKLELK